MSGMQAQGRGISFYRGRGSRGRGQDNILTQHGIKMLIAADLTSDQDPLYKEFLEFKKQKEGHTQTSPPYSKIVGNEEEEAYVHNMGYTQNEQKKKVILFITENDFKRDNKPWELLER